MSSSQRFRSSSIQHQNSSEYFLAAAAQREEQRHQHQHQHQRQEDTEQRPPNHDSSQHGTLLLHTHTNASCTTKGLCVDRRAGESRSLPQAITATSTVFLLGNAASDKRPPRTSTSGSSATLLRFNDIQGFGK